MINTLISSSPSSVILATDLDGTLLAGPLPARRYLRELFSGNIPHAKLIFVTGRGLESILPVLNDPMVPRPDYIIADVGATVLYGDTLLPIFPLQQEISDRWPGTQVVLDALSTFDYLERQSVPQERRCSFLVREGLIDDRLREVVEALGCELLFSAQKYLDVLPKGTGKGSTLKKLCEHFNFNANSVVTAGDTLNDLSMFQERFSSIVVGGAEPALIHAVRDCEGVYLSCAEGCAGIVEGLKHYQFLETQKPAMVHEAGKSDLVMVYHRLPFDELANGKRRKPKTPNGIIPTLLNFFTSGIKGSWVAWSQQASRNPENFDAHVDVDREKYPNLQASRIPLLAKDVDLFYKKFSKEAFWPIIFSFPDKAEFNQDHWKHYLEINEIFAKQAAQEASKGALVWIHDYNLWMVPAFLRMLRPDLKIAFFHHTTFPPSNIFNIIPWRREIIGSLLQCDYIGFHIPRYVENFVDVVRSYAPTKILSQSTCAPRFMTYGCALGVDSMSDSIYVSRREVHLGAHPVGIDCDQIDRCVASPVFLRKTERIRAEFKGKRAILSLERLDYVKGALEKLMAFESLLQKHPEFIGNVVLLNCITPAASGMEVYEALRVEVDMLVGRINGRFSTLDWTPIRYFYRSIPYEDVLTYYAIADIAWITPLRDGLNLVAKEYVATQGKLGGSGVLVLSEFAGVAVELHGALLSNPYDAKNMEETLYLALTLEHDDRTYRMSRMNAIVRNNNVHVWGKRFMDAVKMGHRTQQ
ncbi:MAG: glucosylglycerol-phosphate synthase [Campylobacterales bacterium]|nr:glucosylglycerol-phosphate synthase [Campylobacterales bacterium]MBN2833258.1 glucosylglycerol-phosphate synthase [Campylobacterales bacterium]